MPLWLPGGLADQYPFISQFLRHQYVSCAYRFASKADASEAVILGEMMTMANNESLPDTRQASPAMVSGELANSAMKKKWVRLTICCGGAIICIPVVAVLGLIGWFLVNYFFVQH